MAFFSPRYAGNINLRNSTVFPEGLIAGNVAYIPFKECTLKGVELKLVCRICCYHKRHRNSSHSELNIPLTLSDGQTRIRDEEHLTELHNSTVFMFRAQLPATHLPTCNKANNGGVLHVSYTLELFSERRWLPFKQQDAAVAITVLGVMHLSGNPFSEVNTGELVAMNGQFGQGFDVFASARLPTCGWETNETIPVQLDLARMSGTSVRSAAAFLERNIKYGDKSTTQDISESQSATIPDESEPHVHEEVGVNIPEFTPLSGVIHSTDLSIQYRVRVEIKSADTRLPTLVLSLPIVIGTRQHPRELYPTDAEEPRGRSEAEMPGPSRQHSGYGATANVPDRELEMSSTNAEEPRGRSEAERPGYGATDNVSDRVGEGTEIDTLHVLESEETHLLESSGSSGKRKKKKKKK
ncbi:uncharacterized protein LOC143282005 [Babylonia areolata]|uniref:uncharacterized protein LOC143282005 n=1 Tax=Babylonia areolata TaxID=304850 RepID=UPI003FD177A8